MTDSRTATARRSAAPPTRGSDATRERPDRARAGSWPVRERSLIGPVLGVPPLVAVGLAVGLTALGVFVDLLRLGTVGMIFQVAYGVGCVVAVAWVRRRSLFLPAIQPPLLLAVVVPVLAVLVGAPSSTAGVTEHLLLAGAPLINAFPAMAVTTVLVLLIAGFRLARQRTGPDDAVGLLRARLSGRGPSPADDAAPARRGRDAGGERPSGRRDPDTADRRRAPAKGRRGAATSSAAAGSSATAGTGKGGASTDRGAPSRTRADGGRAGRSGERDGARAGRGRSGRDTARGDGPSDAGRSTARGSSARSQPRSGRTVRGSGSGSGPGSGRSSGDSARSRRPRPSDPD